MCIVAVFCGSGCCTVLTCHVTGQPEVVLVPLGSQSGFRPDCRQKHVPCLTGVESVFAAYDLIILTYGQNVTATDHSYDAFILCESVFRCAPVCVCVRVCVCVCVCVCVFVQCLEACLEELLFIMT